MYDKYKYIVIKDFPKWEINCEGDIRSVKTGNVKYTYIHKIGYKVVQFHKDGKVYTKKIHRLVAKYFLENPPLWLVEKCSKEHHGKVQVNHKDGNKLNNHYENLEWCDHQHNCKHASDTKLNPAPKGTLNGRAVLTEELVHEICKYYEDGGTPKMAEIIFKISRPQAAKIKSGHSWKHIWEQYNITVNRRK